jgi:DNA polymerase-3 subunit chi
VTRIDFHFNAPDKIDYCCRLVRKIYRSGRKVVIYDDRGEALSELDRALWSFSALDFIPHVMVTDPSAIDTPVLLTREPLETPHHEVLVNLAQEPPSFFSRFERMIELVAADAPDDRQRARDRFRFYRERGYPIDTFDLAAGGAR